MNLSQQKAMAIEMKIHEMHPCYVRNGSYKNDSSILFTSWHLFTWQRISLLENKTINESQYRSQLMNSIINFASFRSLREQHKTK